MAKIDVSKIENFEQLNADELRKLFSEYEYEDNSAELNTLKASYQKMAKSKDDATSEAAEWKRKFRDTQSEQEKADAEKAEMFEKLKAENESFKRNALVSGYKADALALGYNDELASKRAEAMANNDFTELNKIDKLFIEVHDKELNAQAIKDTKIPPVGGSDPNSAGNITAEQFSNMGYRERVALLEKSPELYNELISKEK